MNDLIYITSVVCIFIVSPVCINIEAVSSDVIKQTHSSLESCAKSCLEKRQMNCKYFKYIKSSNTCYLSSKNTPDFSSSQVNVTKAPTTKPTPQPKIKTTLKPSKVTSAKPPVKTTNPTMAKSSKGKIKKVQRRNKQINRKEKKNKMKKNLKNLSRVKQKESSTAWLSKKLSSTVDKQSKTINWNSKYLRRLMVDTAALKRQYATLHTYQNRLHGMINSVIMNNKNMSQKMNVWHKKNRKLSHRNVFYQKQFKKLWTSNYKVLKKVLLIQGLVKKNSNLIPKRMRGYLAVLIASVRKFGRMNNQIKRLVKVLLSLKMAESVNRKANIHIVNNLGHMTRSLRVLKSAIPRLASSVRDQIKAQKKTTKITGKIPALISIQKQMTLKLKQMKRKNKAVFRLYSKMMKNLQKEDASKHVKITQKMDTKFSGLDKSVLKLQKQVRQLQMLMMNQVMLQENSTKTANKTSTSEQVAKQKKVDLELKDMKRQNKVMFNLLTKMMNKINKSHVQQKNIIKRLIKKLRKVKKQTKKKPKIVVGKIRHNSPGGYKIVYNKPLRMRRHRKRKHLT